MKQSFTLIELIMVIVIVGILATMAVPKMISMRTDAQKAACFGTSSAIQTALSSYYMRAGMSGNSVFPRTLHDPLFIAYLSEGTLPRHPTGRNWNDYYTTADSVPDGPERYDFIVGHGLAAGVCTDF